MTSGNAVSSGTVIIFRNIPFKRTTDFPTSGSFDMDTLNTELDRNIALFDDQQDRIDRAVRLNDNDDAASMVLPLKASRKGTVLGFNATTGAAEAGPTIANVNSLADITTNINTVAGIASNVTTVAGIDANVSTVAGISSNVSTVAGIQSNVSSVAGNATNINTVAGSIANVNTVATNIADVNAVAADLAETVSEIETVAADLQETQSEIDTVAANIANVNTVGNAITNVNTTATNISNINTLAGISSNVSTVAGINSDVTTVAGISSNVTAVAGDATDIGTVATNIANVNTVGGISGNVTTVAGISGNVSTVAGISSNVSTVAGIDTDVSTVAGISSNVTSVANDASDIGTVASAISNVNTVAGNTTNINTVAGNNSNISTVGGISSNVTTVAGIASNVTTVSGIANAVAIVANDATDIGTVSTNISNVNTLASALTVGGTSSYTVTVVNSGGNKFALNGTTNPTITLKRGFTYTFDQSDSTNANHPLRFKDSSGNAYTTGVTYSGTPGQAGAEVVFAVPSNAPSSLLYYCFIHGNAMGNTITVQDDNVAIVAGISSDITSVAGVASNVTTVAGIASNVTTVASNVSGINDFADRYRVAGSAPSSNNDEGDLYYNTTSDQLFVYNGSAWISAALDASSALVPSNNLSDVASVSTARTNLGLGDAATKTVGISNGNVATFTSGVADNDFLKIDGTTVEGRSASEVASDIGISSYGSSLIDDADAATARTTLGLGTMAVETASDYLTTSSASSTYLTQSSASSTYLTQSSASSTYAPLSGASFTGSVSSSVDFRSDLFRSASNPTTKFVHPDSESQLTALSLDSGTSNNSNDATLFVSATNNNDWGIYIDKYRGSATDYGLLIDVGSSANYAMRLRGNDNEILSVTGNGTTYIQNDIYATRFRDISNSSRYIDPAGDSSIYRLVATDRIQGSTYIEALSYLSSPIMYDYNNTAYYSDPSSNSNLNSVNAQSYLYLGDKLYTNTGGGSSTVGQAGQVLTSGGTTNPVSWQDAGGGAWEVIGNYTGTNVHTVDFVEGVNNFVWDSTTYKRIKMYGTVIMNSNSVYSSDVMLVQALVSSGSSGNVVPQPLCSYVLEWSESYPEFSATLTNSNHLNIYQHNGHVSGGGGLLGYIDVQARDGYNQGNGQFFLTIGGTSYGTNKRRQATAVEIDIATENLATDRSWAMKMYTYNDAPSFYFYPRRFHGQTMSHGWNERGLRFYMAQSSNRINYDFTWIGLKP